MALSHGYSWRIADLSNSLSLQILHDISLMKFALSKSSIQQPHSLVSSSVQILPSLSLPTLNKYNRAFVLLPRAHNIIDHAQNSDSNKHDGCPVERFKIGRGTLRPEAPEEGMHGVQNTGSVDGNTPFTKRPGTGRKKLRGGDTAVENGSNREDVGDHERNDV